tara:strand:+ start:716 stop:883 length:168 start_codon:yes stop_codon:yes gene_type:complete
MDLFLKLLLDLVMAMDHILMLYIRLHLHLHHVLHLILLHHLPRLNNLQLKDHHLQ